MHPLSVTILLALAVATEVVVVVGVLASATVYDRIHYAGAATTLAPFLVLAATIVEEGTHNPAWNAGFVAFTMFFLGAVLSHATARVVRKRERGDLEL